MRKYLKILVPALWPLCASYSGSAHAQNSVTLYGRMTGGVDYVNHVANPNGDSGSAFRYGSNQWGISWWGLTGQEDLGSGYKTVFKLESMFSSGTGTSPDNSLFDRYAYVGIEKDNIGSVWLGRAMSLTDETGWYLDPMAEQAIGVATFNYGRAWGPRSNTITFNSSSFNGLTFRLQAGLGNVAGNFPANRQLSGMVSYQGPSLNVRALYEEIRDQNGNFSNLYSASREYLVGATYVIGQVKLFAGYELISSSGASTVADARNPTGATRNQQVWVGANYQVTPALLLLAGAYHANVNNGGGSGNLGVVGANYSLSKRTLLYATLGGMFNKGNAAFPVETSDAGPGPGGRQQGAYAGIVHSF